MVGDIHLGGNPLIQGVFAHRHLAYQRGMPRQVFTKSPLERKPMYLDVESPVLSRILCRQARQAATQATDALLGFTEMLPSPQQCWLADGDDERYVAELRIVAQGSPDSRARPWARRAIRASWAPTAWGAANVIFVVGAQKLAPTAEAARERIIEHSLKLEDARAYATYGQNSFVGKILEIHQEMPGRIHVVLIRQAVGF